MPQLFLQAQAREVFGRKVKRLRRDGLLPANIYGKALPSKALVVNLAQFRPVYDQAGETNLIELKIKGEEKPRPVLIHHVQLHPVTGHFLHADFHQVSLKEKTEADIPVKVRGESAAVKAQGGVLVIQLHEIKVKALPTDLPEAFEIDISSLQEIGAEVKVSDLKVSQGVEVLNHPEEIVLQIAAPTPEEAEEVKPLAEAAEEVALEKQSEKAEAQESNQG